MNFAITGFKGAGKDTAALALSPELYSKVSFADTLRSVVHTVFGVTYEEMSDRMLKEATLRRWPYKSPRGLLQHVGTELFRDHYPGVWVNAWKRNVIREWGAGKKIVCTDMRFPDEAEAVKDLGFTTVRIVRPSVTLNDVHESERHIASLPVDFEVVNDFETTGEFIEYMRGWFANRS